MSGGGEAKRETGMKAEALQFLEHVAALYETGVANMNESNIKQLEQNSWEALACFLYGYAHERQGASPAYGPAARRVIRSIAASGESWDNPILAEDAWRRYVGELRDVGKAGDAVKLNEKNNPMCPKGTVYVTKNGERHTAGFCAIQFVQQYLSGSDYSVVRWAQANLKDGQVRETYNRLTKINGIGPKIAPFFLRDIAMSYRIEIEKRHRHLLQPIDVWVRRCVYQSAGKMTDAKSAKWIIDQCVELGISPERVNAGMWLFGAEIAGDERTLRKLLGAGVESMEKETDQYVARLAAQVDIWRTLL